MKVVHVLKRIEMLDEDVKELRKMEKSLKMDKSFSNAIYMSIEKQINILLGERIKMLELRIENPPEQFILETEGKPGEEQNEEKKIKSKKPKIKKSMPDIDDIPMLTQDQIDDKISSIKIIKGKNKPEKIKSSETKLQDDPNTQNDSAKILDAALEHGTLNKNELEKKKDRKVKFFRENFPAE